MSTVFLFGAGASYGSEDVNPYPPPLGCGEEGLFAQLAQEEGLPAKLPEDLSTLFVRDFEEGMDALMEREEEFDVGEFLRDLSLYFTRFQPGPENLYCRLIEAVSESQRDVIFATTNYDLLVELAAHEAGFRINYSPHHTPDAIRLLKIHGSCNFLPNIPPENFRNNRFINCSVHVSAPAKVATLSETVRFCRANTSLAPAVALYSPGKRVLYCPDFVDAQREAFLREIERCSRAFVIGLALNEEDAHIWDALAAAEGRLFYVGGEPEDIRAWADRKGRKRVSTLEPTFAGAFPRIVRTLRA